MREPPDKSLARYQAKMVSHSPRRQLITVQRSSNNIIRDVLKEYKRGSFDIQKVPDVEFIGEEGIDAKGLTRQFSHIMMSCLREGKGGIAFLRERWTICCQFTVQLMLHLTIFPMLGR